MRAYSFRNVLGEESDCGYPRENPFDPGCHVWDFRDQGPMSRIALGQIATVSSSVDCPNLSTRQRVKTMIGAASHWAGETAGASGAFLGLTQTT
jgi:hypothetical protein